MTALLERAAQGDADVLDQLFPLVYDELRRIAHVQLSGKRALALQTTEVVHEAYFRMVRGEGVTRRGRGYFFAAAAQAMRQVLVTAARSRGRVKRGSGERPETLDEERLGVDAFAAEILDLDRALTELAAESERSARVVELRYFGGLSVEETAEALEIAPRTVKREWAWARARLFRALRGREATGESTAS